MGGLDSEIKWKWLLGNPPEKKPLLDPAAII
jgi:hypothetical protein